MDFLDPKKRKQNQIRLFIGYGLMAVLIGIVSILLLLQAYGYTYNFRTGDISQNGLLFVDAHPVQATLTLNGDVKGLTDQRLVLKEGRYDISLDREGYHSWTKSTVLQGGVIERYLYPFLFPAEIESSELDLFSRQPEFVTQSPDRQWLVVREPDTPNIFEVFNLSDETPTPFKFALPEGVLNLAGTAHPLELVEWSTDNRHFVVRHDFEGGYEYILIDREQPQLSQNISAAIPELFTTLRLRDKKFDSYYLYNAPEKSLRRFELGAAASTLVVENVLAYHSHGDDELLYVTDEGREAGETVKLRMVDNGETFTIRELMKSDRYLLELAQYEGGWYLIAGPSKEEKVYVFRNPVDLLRRNVDTRIVPAAVLRVPDATHVSFSQNARIVSAQAGSKLGVYDAELRKTYHYDSEIDIADDAEFVWMDGHRLTAIADGVQHVFDFDDSNHQTLGTGFPLSVPYFDRDYTAAFTIAPSEEVSGRAALQRTELIVEEQ